VKRIRSLAVLAFVASTPCAYADSVPILDINITYATAGLGPDGGVVFTLIGPGTSITGYGGMACYTWCLQAIPDLSSVSASQVFVGAYLSVEIAGTSYNPDLLSCCLFSASDNLSGSVSGFVGQNETFRSLNLTLTTGGSWNFNFDYLPPMNGNPASYQFTSGSFTAGTPSTPTPELGTLALMGTALVGLALVIRRRRLLR
jgi:MYXO-CTERM domain-containing protein